MTPQHRKQHPLLPPPHIHKTLTIPLVCPHPRVHNASRILMNTKHIQQHVHLRGHVWLQQDTADTDRFGAEEDDGVDFGGSGGIGVVPGVRPLGVSVCLGGGSG